MATPQDIMKAFESQSNITRDLLIHGYWNEAVISSKLLATILKFKTSELEEEVDGK